MFEVIRGINEQGITVLLIEQNVFDALSIAHGASFLENGQIVIEGTGHELLNSQDIRTTYLGM